MGAKAAASEACSLEPPKRKDVLGACQEGDQQNEDVSGAHESQADGEHQLDCIDDVT